MGTDSLESRLFSICKIGTGVDQLALASAFDVFLVLQPREVVVILEERSTYCMIRGMQFNRLSVTKGGKYSRRMVP